MGTKSVGGDLRKSVLIMNGGSEKTKNRKRLYGEPDIVSCMKKGRKRWLAMLNGCLRTKKNFIRTSGEVRDHLALEVIPK